MKDVEIARLFVRQLKRRRGSHPDPAALDAAFQLTCRAIRFALTRMFVRPDTPFHVRNLLFSAAHAQNLVDALRTHMRPSMKVLIVEDVGSNWLYVAVQQERVLRFMLEHYADHSVIEGNVVAKVWTRRQLIGQHRYASQSLANARRAVECNPSHTILVQREHLRCAETILNWMFTAVWGVVRSSVYRDKLAREVETLCDFVRGAQIAGFASPDPRC